MRNAHSTATGCFSALLAERGCAARSRASARGRAARATMHALYALLLFCVSRGPAPLYRLVPLAFASQRSLLALVMTLAAGGFRLSAERLSLRTGRPDAMPAGNTGLVWLLATAAAHAAVAANAVCWPAPALAFSVAFFYLCSAPNTLPSQLVRSAGGWRLYDAVWRSSSILLGVPSPP